MTINAVYIAVAILAVFSIFCLKVGLTELRYWLDARQAVSSEDCGEGGRL